MDPELPIDRFEIFAANLDHPECLTFDREGNCWAGGEAGQVYRISPAGEVQQIATLEGFNCGVAWSPFNDLWVCNVKHGIVRVQPTGEWSIFADGMTCPNFGLFDSAGNYYLTDSGNWKKRNGRLLRFTPDGRREVLLENYGYTNGLALDADTLYMVESDTDRIFAIDLRTLTPTVFAEEVGRMPDGLALDPARNLYATCYASDEIWRLTPHRALYAWDRWAILISRPTNLVFHGDHVYVANLGRTTITRARLTA